MDSDLNYVFLAPSVNWRGGRMFVSEHQGADVAPKLGYIELPQPMVVAEFEFLQGGISRDYNPNPLSDDSSHRPRTTKPLARGDQESDAI